MFFSKPFLNKTKTVECNLFCLKNHRFLCFKLLNNIKTKNIKKKNIKYYVLKINSFF